DLPGLPGTATPTPAPPVSVPDSGPKDTIPPATPKLPELPGPKPPMGGNDTLPPLVLPPETPGSVSKASPLSGTTKRGLSVQVLTASGPAARASTRKVGFYNYTDRDIELVIEGRAVTLPKMTYIHAEVSPTFRWKYADQAMRAENVPDGAAGLDVLFRE